MVKPRPYGADVICDCCGREKLAEVRGGKLVILARRHGHSHEVKIPLDGVTGFSAILPTATDNQGKGILHIF